MATSSTPVPTLQQLSTTPPGSTSASPAPSSPALEESEWYTCKDSTPLFLHNLKPTLYSRILISARNEFVSQLRANLLRATSVRLYDSGGFAPSGAGAPGSMYVVLILSGITSYNQYKDAAAALAAEITTKKLLLQGGSQVFGRGVHAVSASPAKPFEVNGIIGVEAMIKVKITSTAVVSGKFTPEEVEVPVIIELTPKSSTCLLGYTGGASAVVFKILEQEGVRTVAPSSYGPACTEVEVKVGETFTKLRIGLSNFMEQCFYLPTGGSKFDDWLASLANQIYSAPLRYSIVKSSVEFKDWAYELEKTYPIIKNMMDHIRARFFGKVDCHKGGGGGLWALDREVENLERSMVTGSTILKQRIIELTGVNEAVVHEVLTLFKGKPVLLSAASDQTLLSMFSAAMAELEELKKPPPALEEVKIPLPPLTPEEVKSPPVTAVKETSEVVEGKEEDIASKVPELSPIGATTATPTFAAAIQAQVAARTVEQAPETSSAPPPLTPL